MNEWMRGKIWPENFSFFLFQTFMEIRKKEKHTWPIPYTIIDDDDDDEQDKQDVDDDEPIQQS